MMWYARLLPTCLLEAPFADEMLASDMPAALQQEHTEVDVL